MAAAIPDVEDELDRRRVCTERVALWRTQETRTWTLDEKQQQAVLKGEVRKTVIGCMARIFQLIGTPQRHWFEAVGLLDASCARGPRPASLAELPAQCEAVIYIVLKADSVVFSPSQYCVAPLLTQMAQQLRARGRPEVKDPSTESALQQEKLILTRMEWRVASPISHESWLSLFCERLDVLLRGWFSTSASYGWVWNQAICYAGMVIMKHPVPTMLPMRLMAGLFGLALCRAGLLPSAALRPDRADPVEWQKKVESSCLRTERPAGPALPAEITDQLLRLVLRAIGLQREELQDAVDATAGAVAEALADMQEGAVAS